MTKNRLGLDKPPRYKKLVKHKRRPKKETKAFSKNTAKRVYEKSDGSYGKKSILTGRTTHYTKTGKVKKVQSY